MAPQNLTISHFQCITNPPEADATTYVYTVSVDEASVPYKDVDLIDTDETLVYESSGDTFRISFISAINIDEQNPNTVEIIVDPEQHFLLDETSSDGASNIKCKFYTSIFCCVMTPCKV